MAKTKSPPAPVTYLAVAAAGGPAINVHRGEIFETADTALAADLIRAGYVVKYSKGLTLERADALAEKARAKSAP